jgi:molybdenum cofactor cytidylyltransferase
MTSDPFRGGPAGFGAIVLAAGASERMGGVPKALLPVDGVTSVERMARVCAEAGLFPVVTVVGPHGPAIRRALEGTEVLVADNARSSQGRTGSIQVGIAALGPATGALLWPVDHPFVEAKTVGTLLRRADQDAMAVWVIPTFGGRGGHPVLLRQPTFRSILEMPPERPLRSLLSGFGPQVVRVPVNDPGVVENLDTPEEYRAAIARRRGEGTG